jgi:hypothetical protein
MKEIIKFLISESELNLSFDKINARGVASIIIALALCFILITLF